MPDTKTPGLVEVSKAPLTDEERQRQWVSRNTTMGAVPGSPAAYSIEDYARDKFGIVPVKSDNMLSYAREKYDLVQVKRDPSAPTRVEDKSYGQVIGHGVAQGTMRLFEQSADWAAKELTPHLGYKGLTDFIQTVGRGAESFLEEHPEWESEMPQTWEETLLSGKAMLSTAASTAPFAAAAMGAFAAGSALGGPQAGLAGGFFVAFMGEGGSEYRRALDGGATRAEAHKSAVIYGSIASVIEMAQASAAMRFIRGDAGKRAFLKHVMKKLQVRGTEGALKRYARVAGKISLEVLTTAVEEGFEEVAQGISQEEIGRLIWDDPTVPREKGWLNRRVLEFIGGAGAGGMLGGAGRVLKVMNDKAARGEQIHTEMIDEVIDMIARGEEVRQDGIQETAKAEAAEVAKTEAAEVAKTEAAKVEVVKVKAAKEAKEKAVEEAKEVKEEAAKEAKEKAVEEAKEEAAERQPWEMRREEYPSAMAKELPQEHIRTDKPPFLDETVRAYGERVAIGPEDYPQVGQIHDILVQRAIKAGKSVPRQVLQDYAGEKWADEALAKMDEAKKPTTPAKTDKRVKQFRDLADGMDEKIDAKRNPAISQQNVTARRARIAAGMGQEADRLAQVQTVLRGISDAIEAGTVPDSLAGITSKAQLDTLLMWEKMPTAQNADYARLVRAGIDTPTKYDAARQAALGMTKSLTKEELRARELADLERGLIGRKIPGFFPTPKSVISKILTQAGIESGMSVLEPSAGKGDIADTIASEHPDADLDVVEYNRELRDVLEAKGYSLAGQDFLEHRGQYDRIVMNPPFEKGQDIEHVRHAYELLKPGGRVVAIMSEGPFSRTDAKATAFREWFETVGGESEKLAAGSFAGAGSFRQTGASARIVEIDKPASQEKEAAKTKAKMEGATKAQPKRAGRLEKELLAVHEKEIGPIDAALVEAGGAIQGEEQYGHDVFVTSFAGPLPTELREALQGRANLRMKLRSNVAGATGEDALKALGTDEYVRRLEHLAGGKSGAVSQAIDAVEELAKGRQDAELLLQVQQYRNVKAGGEQQIEQLDTSKLTVGDTFEAAGDDYVVKRHDTEAGILEVEDGVTGFLVDDTTIPIDKGTFRPAKSESKRKTDLFGKDVVESIGSETSDLGIGKGETVELAVGETAVKPTLVKEANRLISEQKDISSPTELYMAILQTHKAEASKFFNDASQPMREVAEAYTQATKGGSLFGPAGSPRVGGDVDTGHIKVSMKPSGKPTSAREIVDYLSRAFNIVIRGKATHKMRIYAGWFDPRAKGIRLKNVRQLSTAIHEVGHHIDWSLNNRLSKNPPKGTAKELMALGKALYGDKQPTGGYKSEGWAEFLRMYMTGDNAAEAAPNLHKWFTEEYLPSHKDTAKKIAIAKDMVTAWRMQGAEARIESMINRKPITGTLGQRIRRAGLWLDTHFRDELAPLKSAMKRAGIKKGDLRPDEDPYELAVAYADKAGAKARQFVLHYTTDLAGNRTGPGLREVVKPVTGDIKTFTRWITAARALDLHKRGIDSGYSKADSQYVYDLYDSKEWRDVAQGVTDWNHRILDYLVEAGGLDAAAARKMKELNPVYVPFMVAFGPGEMSRSGGVGRGIAPKGKAVKAIRGSSREKIDPFEAMIQQAERLISTAQMADVARAIAKLANRPGMASMIWKVPAPTQVTKVTAEQLKGDVISLARKYLGVDTEEIASGALEEWDEILTIYSNATTYFGKDNIVALVVDGKRQFYEFDPELYKVIKGLDQYQLPWYLAMTLGKATRGVRLGATGLNPSFGLIRNFIRDAMTFTVLAEHAKLGPVSAAGGVLADLRNTADAAKFKAMGGKMSGQIMQDRIATQNLRGSMLASTAAKYTVHTVAHPVNAIREVFGVSEAGTRIGEFQPALEYAEAKWGKGSKAAAIYALNAAQDVTTNFTRHGRIAKQLNQMIPFFNAQIQGPDKVVRTFRVRPLRTTLMAISALTVPAIWLWWMNKDEEWYKNLDTHEKTNYLHFRIPGTDTIVRLPVPFELGAVFQSIPVAAMDAMYTGDPESLPETLVQAAKNANPLDWPAAIGPAIEVIANEDFAGRPIVPGNVRSKMPEDQAKAHTTQLMLYIGKTLKVSPAKLEHLINAHSGGLYGRLSRSAEYLLEHDQSERTKSDWPVIGTLFLRDPFAPRKQIRRFYDKLEELSEKHASGKDTRQERRDWQEHSAIARELSPFWKSLRTAKTITGRKIIYGRIARRIKRVQ